MERALALVGAIMGLIGGAVWTVAAGPSPSTPSQMVTWAKWQHLEGVFDLGLEADAMGLIAQGSELFFTIKPSGTITAINTGSSYRGVPGFEAYFAVSSGEPAAGPCRFQHGAIYVINPRSTKQVLEVDPRTGHPLPFATIPGVDSLNGIAFDGGGGFGDHPLLVTGPAGSREVVAAIDCHGDVRAITNSAPRMEGGISVAPDTFGGHAGELIATDEINGDIIGIRPSGVTSTVANLAHPTGPDLGVESSGFLPRGFFKNGGFAYLADRGTANNPHPGTNSILRLTSAQLEAAGVLEGDLLVATEGGGATVAVTCAATCSLRAIAAGPPTGHIEGHIVFLANQPGQAPPAETPPSPHPKPSPTPAPSTPKTNLAGLGLAGVGILIFLVAVILAIRRGRAT
jgi:hypothetical protein